MAAESERNVTAVPITGVTAPVGQVSNYDWLFQRTPGHILWHYTTWEGLESILKTGELWASDYRFMNDTTELRNALEFHAGEYPEELKDVNAFIENIRAKSEPLPSAYVLSTSNEFDSLEQWRGYAGSSVGVALGFDKNRLALILKSQGLSEESCLYEDSDKANRVTELRAAGIERRQRLRAAIAAAKNDAERTRVGKSSYYGRTTEIAEFMARAALVFKDFRFRNEREVRFISKFEDLLRGVQGLGYVGPSIDPKLKAYRRRSTALMPYLKLRMTMEIEIDGKLIAHPLVGLLFGPNSEPEILKTETEKVATWIGTLVPALAEFQNRVKVALTTVPLRA